MTAYKTYQDRKENHYNFVLIENNVVLGTFGSLKKITEFIKDETFPSYWTLVRKKENPIEFGNYSITKVKHY